MRAFPRRRGSRRWRDSKGSSAGSSCAARRAASPSTTTSRTTRRRSRRRWTGCGTQWARERILAVLEPRSNTMKLGAVKDALPGSLTGADLTYCYAGKLGWDPAAALAPLGAKAAVFGDLDALVTRDRRRGARRRSRARHEQRRLRRHPRQDPAAARRARRLASPTARVRSADDHLPARVQFRAAVGQGADARPRRRGSSPTRRASICRNCTIGPRVRCATSARGSTARSPAARRVSR